MEDEDVCNYYSLIHFFTEFCRTSTQYDEQRKLEMLRETFSMELFHSIEIFIQRCAEMMKMEKKLTRVWSKRMHTAIRCYKENLTVLFALQRKLDRQEKQNDEERQRRMASNDAQRDDVDLDENERLVNMVEALIDLDAPNEPRLLDVAMQANGMHTGANDHKPATTPKSLLDEKSEQLVDYLKSKFVHFQIPRSSEKNK